MEITNYNILILDMSYAALSKLLTTDVDSLSHEKKKLIEHFEKFSKIRYKEVLPTIDAYFKLVPRAERVNEGELIYYVKNKIKNLLL